MAKIRTEDQLISHARLLEVLDYNPDTGVFKWKISLRKGYVGKVAGSVQEHKPGKRGSGYVYIRIDGDMYTGHRLAWFYVNGTWPSEQIDHINRVRDDNRIVNLRGVPHAGNCHNNRKTLDAKGYTFEPESQRYRAQASIDGKIKNLGRFDTPEEARAAYLKATDYRRIKD